MNFTKAALTAAALIAPAAAQAVTYDAFTSFNGVNGAGRFSYSMTPVTPGPGAPLTPGGASCVIPGSICFQAGAGLPGVYKSATAFQYGTVAVPNDRLLFHPGPAQNVLATFTAPTSATYYITLALNVVDNNPSGVNIFRFTNEGGTVSGGPLGSLGAGNLSQTFTTSINLIAGQFVGFGINPAGNFSNDSIGVNFTLSDVAPGGVPEPAEWAMLLTGFGALGAVTRRRRARISAVVFA